MRFLTDILAKAGLVVDGTTTLNGAAAATVDTDKFVVLDGSVVKFRTGTQMLSDIGAQAALTNPVMGTGTSGQVAYWNGTNTVTGSSTFTFSPTAQLLLNNSVTAATAIARGANFTPTLVASANSDVLVGLDIAPTFTNGAFTGVTNYAIRTSGETLLRGSGSTNATNALIVQNNAGNASLTVNNARFTTIYGLATPQTILTDSNGVLTLAVNNFNLDITGGVGNNNIGVLSLTSTNINANFGGTKTLFDVTASWTTTSANGGALIGIRYAPTINQSGSAIGITRGLYVNPTLTAAADWRSIEWSNTSGWGLYGAGSVKNYISGNTIIGGTATDGGQKLQVNGDAFIKGSGNTSVTTALTVQNSDGNNMLSVRNDQFVTIGTLSGTPTIAFGGGNNTIFRDAGDASITFRNTFSGTPIFKFTTNSNLSNTNTTGNNIFVSFLSGFAPTSGTGTWAHLSLTPSINQTGGANGITRGLYVNPTLTAAADWRSIETSNNTGWAAYFAGSADIFVGDGADIQVGSTNGTKIGTATTQKIGFFNATPIVQPSGNILTALSNLGLVATPTISVSDVTNAVPTSRTLTINGTAFDLSANRSWSVGTVTSVDLSLPNIFTVTGSPVTSSGTITATLASQTANTFFAAPNGSAGAPTFRAIVAADIPTLNQNTTGQAGSVANSFVLRADSGTTEGTDIYTFNGSAAKNINIVAGTNMTITKVAGQWTISTTASTGTVTSVALSTGTSGTDVNVSGSPITGSGTITLNIPDASASARGLVTTGTQTFGGAKTFNNIVTIGASGAGSIGLNIDGTTNTAGYVAIKSGVSGYAYQSTGYVSLTSSQVDYLSISYQGATKIANFIGSSLTAIRNYTLPNASGTLALTSDLTGFGTVTSVSVVSANGFAGTVATASTTPAITLTTTVTGLLKGNGTAISAAVLGTDYVASNLYTADGTLAGNRTVTQSTFDLTFAATTSSKLFSTGNWTIGGTVDSGYKLEVIGTSRIGNNPNAVQLTVNGNTLSNGLTTTDTLSFTGTNKIIYSNELTFSTNNSLANSTRTLWLFTSQTPAANSGIGGVVDLVKLSMPVNNGTQSADSRALVIDFNVTTNLGTLTAIDAVSGLVRLRNLSGSGTRMVVSDANGVLSTQAIPGGGGSSTTRYNEEFTATSNQTAFTVTNALTNGYFDVYLNGVKLDPNSFTNTSTVITLVDGAAAGDILQVVNYSTLGIVTTLPSQTGNSGKYLTTDGTNLSWATVSSGAYTVTSVSTTYSETATSGTKIIKADTTGGAFTITLPTAVGNGATLIIKKTAGSADLTIDGAGSETIDGGATATVRRVDESITLISDNSNWFIV